MQDLSLEEVTARLTHAEEALESSQRLLLASQYASAIMHEVNNPLEAMTNLVYLTKLDKDQPDQVMAYMLLVEQQLSLLGRVTSQALTYHRAHVDPKQFDLVDIAESALKLHAEKITHRGVTIDRRFRGPATATMQGSEVLQVLSNLILNAVDALDRRDGRLCLCVHGDPTSVHLMVTDNGPGISEKIVAKLFSPYATSKKSGTGLGLWLSRRIIEKHGGTLRFRTARRGTHAGTSFRFSLPRVPA